MSRGNHQGYGAVREYRDDPGFNDYRDQSGTDFEDTFSQITRNITTINTGANNIEKAAKVLGTDRDNGQFGNKIHSVSQETHKTIDDTTRLFRKLNQRRLDRTQRLRLDKVQNDFRDSVKRFQGLQKKAVDRVKTVSRQEQQKVQKSHVWLDDEDDEPLIEEDNTRRQQLMAQEQVIDDDLALIRDREEQIRALEGDILDVNEIFRDLGAMIYEQGEQIDTIEANVEKASTDVEQGAEQLGQASKYQKKARKKLCCLVVILVIIAAVIAIIIAVSVKK